GDLAQPIVLSSDGQGRFSSPDLKPGAYTVRITREKFETLTKSIDLRAAVDLEFKLTIAEQHVEVTVPGKALAYGHSDPVYRQLHNLGLGTTFRIENFSLPLDCATFEFKKGTLTVLHPVNGVVTGAVFVGEGHLTLKPVTLLDAAELKRRSGAAELEEDFTDVVFRFTGEERRDFFPALKEQVETPPEAASVFERWKEKMRKRREEP